MIGSFGPAPLLSLQASCPSSPPWPVSILVKRVVLLLCSESNHWMASAATFQASVLAMTKTRRPPSPTGTFAWLGMFSCVVERAGEDADEEEEIRSRRVLHIITLTQGA